MTSNKICLSFDNEILSGYYIDTQSRRAEVKELKKKGYSEAEQKDIITQIYKKYYDALKEQKLVGKIKDRYMAVDLNPEYIGYCIADRGVDGIAMIIEKGTIDLRELHVKLNLPSDHPLVVKQNNKRVNEVQNAWVKLFDICNHYKCAHFVKEDINNIGESEKFDSKEANRKTKNLWHRELTEWQINKRCVMFGIELIPIKPFYTSFIGNLMYGYFDATNASIEICRRGMFFKGLFYPTITGTISDTMSKFFEQQNVQLKPRDAQIFKDCKQWDKLFKIATHNGLRWRWGWDKVDRQFSSFSMASAKSKVRIVRFA